MAKGERETLPVYELRPPPWLPKTHASADLGKVHTQVCCVKLTHSLVGYTGFYPPRPGDVEENLAHSAVQNGLTLPPVVSVSCVKPNAISTMLSGMCRPRRTQRMTRLETADSKYNIWKT